MKPTYFLCKKDVSDCFYEGKEYLFSFDETNKKFPYVCAKDESGDEHTMTKGFLDQHFLYIGKPSIPKPYCNPYSLAKKAYDDTQITQIQKGMKKYGTPLHPSNHSSEELFNHTMEELVDLSHYIAAYHYKMHHIKERLLLAQQETTPEAIQVHIALALKQIGDTV